MPVRFLALVPLFAAARADGPDLTRVFGRDNAQFARQLFRSGYWDLSDRYCTAFESAANVDAVEKAAVGSVHLDLRLERARDEKDPLKRKDAIAAVLKEKVTFIKEFAGTQEAADAELNLPDAYRVLGESITDALKKVTDPEAMKQLRDEGSQAFAQAGEVLHHRKIKLEEELNNAELTDAQLEELHDRHAVAWFNLERTSYFRAQLFPPGDPQRTKYLKEAQQQLEEFSLEYTDKLNKYEGLVIRGLCAKELGNPDEAIANFDEVIALREGFEADKQEVPPYVEDVISSAVQQKMLLLTEANRANDAIDVCKDFWKKAKNPSVAQFGLAALAAQADAELKLNDTAAAQQTAQKLLDFDPSGPWGNKGREILTGGGTKSTTRLESSQFLKFAQSLVQEGKYERAIEMCATAMSAARGTDSCADVSLDSAELMAFCYGKLNDYMAAVVVLDEAVSRFPKAQRADDALDRAIRLYSELLAKDRRKFYRDAIDARRTKLKNDYPKSPRAAQLQMAKGDDLVIAQKYVEASDEYLKLEKGTTNYEEAQFRAGRCLFLETQKLAKAKQPDAVKALAPKVDAQLRKAMKILDEATTLDLKQKADWESESFDCRTLLANLYMFEGVGRQGDVIAILEGVEDRFANDPSRVSTAWALRIQALNALGQLDKAEALLVQLLEKSPDAKSSAIAAGVFARSCDQRANDLFAKDPKSKDGEECWKKAYKYYRKSLESKLTDAAAARSNELAEIAQRFVYMGQHFNGVPENVTSFLHWQGKLVAPEYWESANELYEASLKFVDSYLVEISRARVLGFLGRFRDAASAYSTLFEHQQLVKDAAKLEINKELLAAKPTLMAAYFEWGVVECRIAKENNDTDRADRFARANSIFDIVIKNTLGSSRSPSETWFQACYWQIRTLVDQGEYVRANTFLKRFENTTNEEDRAKYGLSEPLKKVKAELKDKVFNSPTPSPSEKKQP